MRNTWGIVAVVVCLLAGCKTAEVVPPGERGCGDGVVQAGEACDGADLAGATCADFGFAGGALRCTADCTDIDTSGCNRCGDTFKEPSEICDGNDLAGETCQSLGFSGGALACRADCAGFRTNQCTGTGPSCGNDVRESTEACDGTDLAGVSCFTMGYDTGTPECNGTCDGFDVANCTSLRDGNCCEATAGLPGCTDAFIEGCVCAVDPYCCAVEWDAQCVTTVGLGCGSCAGASCGNDLIDGYEACDGTDLGGQTCASLGFAGGTPACLGDCSAHDTSACTGSGPICGNNVAEGLEECDGTDLRGAGCADLLWYSGGTLACRPGCDGYDVSGCSMPGGGDCCETNSSGGCDDYTVETCVCSADRFCCTFEWDANCVTQVDTLGCGRCFGFCGDNYADIGERCDGFNLRGYTCEALGFSGGTLACANDCLGFATTVCTGGGPVCGNGTVEGLEPCDGANLDGKTCADLRFAGGDLACDPNCDRFDVSGCIEEIPTSCGDGIINGFDRCDGSAWRSVSDSECASHNLGSGTMVCTSLCRPDFSLCELTDVCAAYGMYNDGTCWACEWFGGTADPDCALQCTANGVCNSDCLYHGVVDPDCAVCGNGIREDDEECDGTDLLIDECEPFGYAGGAMGCTSTCKTDFSGCSM